MRAVPPNRALCRDQRGLRARHHPPAGRQRRQPGGMAQAAASRAGPQCPPADQLDAGAGTAGRGAAARGAAAAGGGASPLPPGLPRVSR
jgi:hypothetical protein